MAFLRQNLGYFPKSRKKELSPSEALIASLGMRRVWHGIRESRTEQTRNDNFTWHLLGNFVAWRQRCAYVAAARDILRIRTLKDS